MSEAEKRFSARSSPTPPTNLTPTPADPPIEEEEERPEEQPWEPTTADDVLRYLRENLVKSLADADFTKALLFEDVLVGDRGARYRLSVAESLWDGKPCFVVEGESSGVADRVRWKSHLTATVEIPSLGTVRQKRVFVVESRVEESGDDDPEEPLVDVVETVTTVEMLKRPVTPAAEEAPNDDGEGEDEESSPKMNNGEEGAEEPVPEIPMHVTYRVTKTLKHAEDREEVGERALTEEESAKFFPEGALAVLMRCLVGLRFENLAIPLELLDFDLDFQLCPVTCLRGKDVRLGRGGGGGEEPEERAEAVEGEGEKEAFSFRLAHACSDGIVYAVETRHLPSGQLVFRKQEEPYEEYCLPATEEPVEKKASLKSAIVEKPPVFPKQDLIVEEDLELFSKYQDRTEEMKASHLTYSRKHPELKTILADFLEEVLTIKPGKFLPFASSYFATFQHVETAALSRAKSRSTRTSSAVTTVTDICACEEPDPEDYS